jgi:hypothetical protein
MGRQIFDLYAEDPAGGPALKIVATIGAWFAHPLFNVLHPINIDSDGATFYYPEAFKLRGRLTELQSDPWRIIDATRKACITGTYDSKTKISTETFDENLFERHCKDLPEKLRLMNEFVEAYEKEFIHKSEWRLTYPVDEKTLERGPTPSGLHRTPFICYDPF